MREIKFRAWQDGKMLFQHNSGVYGTKYFFQLLYEDTDLMQFTGLKDKNGNDIYEGDILQKTTTGNIDGRIPRYKIVGKVKKVTFYEGCFRLTKSGRSKNYHLNSVAIRYYGFEVIGNIYQHPELIKQAAS